MRVRCLSASVVADILKSAHSIVSNLYDLDMTHIEFFLIDDCNSSSCSVGSRNVDCFVSIWADGCACCIVLLFYPGLS